MERGHAAGLCLQSDAALHALASQQTARPELAPGRAPVAQLVSRERAHDRSRGSHAPTQATAAGDYSRVRNSLHLVAESFAWPFRHASASTWAIGVVSVLLLPVLFIPLLGYAVAATREAQEGVDGPPRWRLSLRLLSDGFWTALVIVITVLPFALALNPLAAGLHWLHEPYAHVIAFFVLALLWGLVALLLLPHATAAFASSGEPRDLFNVAASVRGIRADFVTWNVVAAAIVTSWAIAVACVGLLCVGLVPGVFYAILVSAHAAATLQRKTAGQDISAR